MHTTVATFATCFTEVSGAACLPVFGLRCRPAIHSSRVACTAPLPHCGDICRSLILFLSHVLVYHYLCPFSRHCREISAYKQPSSPACPAHDTELRISFSTYPHPVLPAVLGCRRDVPPACCGVYLTRYVHVHADTFPSQTADSLGDPTSFATANISVHCSLVQSIACLFAHLRTHGTASCVRRCQAPCCCGCLSSACFGNCGAPVCCCCCHALACSCTYTWTCCRFHPAWCGAPRC